MADLEIFQPQELKGKRNMANKLSPLSKYRGTGKVYVCVLWNEKDKRGYVFTTKNLTARWNTISSELRRNTFHLADLVSDWNWYGIEGFKIKVIRECENRQLAKELAHALIVALGANAYNPVQNWREESEPEAPQTQIEGHLTVSQMKDIRMRSLRGEPSSDIASTYGIAESTVTILANCWELTWL